MKKNVVKHPPEKVSGVISRGDLYVSRNSNFLALYRRATKLLGEDVVITIHGLGAAISGASDLALRLRDSQHAEISATTSSVELVDEHLPDDDDSLPEMSRRVNSAIHITVRRRKIP